MTSQVIRRGRTAALRLLALGWMAASLAGCGSGLANPAVSVPSLPSEDLAGSCRYELVQQDPLVPQLGVLVIFERGDSEALFEDPSVRAMALAQHFSILWAHECNARSTGDLQADASKGPARTLQVALSEFGTRSGHPELAAAPLVLYGFSAAGVLTLTMENVLPQRLLGVIAYAAGSSYTDLDDVSVSAAAAGVPTLLLANAEDDEAGTQRSFAYFERGRAIGAQWGYGVQNKTDHCCNLSTRSVILPWIEAIAPAVSTGVSATAGSAEAPKATTAAMANFACTPDGVEDAQGDTDCSITDASLGPAASATPETGWLPNATAGAAWLTWVTSPGTN